MLVNVGNMIFIQWSLFHKYYIKVNFIKCNIFFQFFIFYTEVVKYRELKRVLILEKLHF